MSERGRAWSPGFGSERARFRSRFEGQKVPDLGPDPRVRKDQV